MELGAGLRAEVNGNGKIFVQLRDLEKALNADVVKKSKARGTSPTWLKSFAGQLEDPEYVSLTLTERGFLHDLRLLALRRGNKILVDEAYLRGQLRLTPRTQCVPKVDRLRTLGFLEPYNAATNSAANQLLPSRTNLENSENESRPEVEGEVDPPYAPPDVGQGGSSGRALPPLEDDPPRRQRQRDQPKSNSPYDLVLGLIKNLGADVYERDALDSELDFQGITDPAQRAELHSIADSQRNAEAAA